ncbi:MAG: LemA-like protein [Parcubacteria group bacterium GW2011_GWD2_38_11]|nr:MAG: LemA-like protein [Parcubacteria group bacterium GW2011_GWD2_38_11]
MNVSLIVLVVLGLFIVFGIGIYNSLVTLKNRVDEAWSDIDVQLKRRYDLIPNLINTVKGYATHEKELFERVTAARTAAMNAGSPAEKQDAENMLSGTLKSLFAVSENYPDLKANQNFLELQRELTDTEDKIQASRRFYNGNVRDFNIKIETFPSNIIAGMLNFSKREFFAADEAEKENVKVQF